jgi:hypothetical protein
MALCKECLEKVLTQYSCGKGAPAAERPELRVYEVTFYVRAESAESARREADIILMEGFFGTNNPDGRPRQCLALVRSVREIESES